MVIDNNWDWIFFIFLFVKPQPLSPQCSPQPSPAYFHYTPSLRLTLVVVDVLLPPPRPPTSISPPPPHFLLIIIIFFFSSISLEYVKNLIKLNRKLETKFILLETLANLLKKFVRNDFFLPFFLKILIGK